MRTVICDGSLELVNGESGRLVLIVKTKSDMFVVGILVPDQSVNPEDTVIDVLPSGRPYVRPATKEELEAGLPMKQVIAFPTVQVAKLATFSCHKCDDPRIVCLNFAGGNDEENIAMRTLEHAGVMVLDTVLGKKSHLSYESYDLCRMGHACKTLPALLWGEEKHEYLGFAEGDFFNPMTGTSYKDAKEVKKE